MKEIKKISKVKCFDGAYYPVETIVGYCTNKKHEGYINRGISIKHDCKGKACRYFQSCTKVKEQDIKQCRTIDTINTKNINETQYKKYANDLAIKLHFPIVIVRVIKTKKYLGFNYCIEFVSASKTPDWDCYHSLAVEMGKLFKAKFFIHHLKHPNGTLVTTAEWFKMRK